MLIIQGVAKVVGVSVAAVSRALDNNSFMAYQVREKS
jgi:DNA-binding LacI/PurR family transcriptional regulator